MKAWLQFGLLLATGSCMAAPTPDSCRELRKHGKRPEAAVCFTALTKSVDPAKRDLMAKKEELEQKIDALKYQKAAMEPGEYKQQLTSALLELAKVQAQLDK